MGHPHMLAEPEGEWGTHWEMFLPHLFCHFIMVASEAIRWKISLTRSTLAYVTYQDIRKISGLKDQTVIVVKAPPETRLEVPDCVEVRRQVLVMPLECIKLENDQLGWKSGLCR